MHLIHMRRVDDVLDHPHNLVIQIIGPPGLQESTVYCRPCMHGDELVRHVCVQVRGPGLPHAPHRMSGIGSGIGPA